MPASRAAGNYIILLRWFATSPLRYSFWNSLGPKCCTQLVQEVTGRRKATGQPFFENTNGARIFLSWPRVPQNINPMVCSVQPEWLITFNYPFFGCLFLGGTVLFLWTGPKLMSLESTESFLRVAWAPGTWMAKHLQTAKAVWRPIIASVHRCRWKAEVGMDLFGQMGGSWLGIC